MACEGGQPVPQNAFRPRPTGSNGGVGLSRELDLRVACIRPKLYLSEERFLHLGDRLWAAWYSGRRHAKTAFQYREVS